MRHHQVALVGSILLLASPVPDVGAAPVERNQVHTTLRRLAADTDGSATATLDRATGFIRLLRIPVGKLRLQGSTPADKTTSFFSRYGPGLGIRNPGRDLELVGTRTDSLGMTHTSFRQVHRRVPVFAAVVRLHFNPDGSLAAYNGTVVPDVDVETAPTLDASVAAAVARRHLAILHSAPELEVENNPPTLVVYPRGIGTGRNGTIRLAWEVEVSHHSGRRAFVFVDAHDGSIVDRLPGIYDLHRVVHDRNEETTIWEEGDSLPFTSSDAGKQREVNIIIESTATTFRIFEILSDGSYPSFDGHDADLRNVYDPEEGVCFGGPNASWNGTVTSFCRGLAREDIVGHEWTHAYTQFTDNLIYRHQPGALNESYSDIFGELVEFVGKGTLRGSPGERTDGGCSQVSGHGHSEHPVLEVHEPASIAGLFVTGSTSDGRDRPWSVTATVELAEDGEGNHNDACQPLANFTAGRIALIAQGGCQWREKYANAADAGAVGIIAVHDDPGGTGSITNTWSDPLPLPGVTINQRDGTDLKAAVPLGVAATISLSEGLSDESLRWIVGENVSIGAIRDMWNPVCHSHPGRTSEYRCPSAVHTNSGIPNHAFALLVDGGRYNRQSVRGIGATKAAHIYWRAMSVYQGPATALAEHADSLELSCYDLVGATLSDLETGLPSSEVIEWSDCLELQAVMLAVEMRNPLTHCDYTPVLQPDPPSVWGTTFFSETFDDSRALGRWTTSNEGFDPGYRPKNWQWVAEPMVAHSGGAAFADDRFSGQSCSDLEDDGLSGAMRLHSPVINLPDDVPSFVVAFDHMVATSNEWDGGNVKISVDGGPFELIDGSRFRFNPYNGEVIRSQGHVVSTNPLVGQPAFTGIDDGEVIGSWGQSQIDLEGLAGAGDSIRLRFDFGRAGCVSRDGWYLDNVSVVATKPPVRRAGRRVRP